MIFNLALTPKSFLPARPYSFNYMGQGGNLEQEEMLGALMEPELMASLPFFEALSPPNMDILLT